MAFKLQKLALLAIAESDIHIQLVNEQSLGKKDVLLVISCAGLYEVAVLAAEVAQKNETYICAMTSLQENSLYKFADNLLFNVVDEKMSLRFSISSRTAQNTVTDLIFTGVIPKIGRKTEQAIESSAAIIKLMDS